MRSLQNLSCCLLPVVLFAYLTGVSGSEEGNWTIYYDLEGEPVPQLGGALRENTLRYGYLPCTCQDLICGCCMSININFANFSRNACMNFTYLPTDFALEMNILMNEESVFKRNISGKNPPPACMEIPINYLPTMQFCIKFFEIYTNGTNLHTCINFETRIERAPILVLEFDCFFMGTDGLSHQKPTESSVSVTSEEGGTKKNITAKVPEVILTFPEHTLPFLLLPEQYKKNKNFTLHIKTQLLSDRDEIVDDHKCCGEEYLKIEHSTNINTLPGSMPVSSNEANIAIDNSKDVLTTPLGSAPVDKTRSNATKSVQ